MTALERYRKMQSDAEASEKLAAALQDPVERRRMLDHASQLRTERALFLRMNARAIDREERAEQQAAEAQAKADESARIAKLRPVQAELEQRRRIDPMGATIYAQAHGHELLREEMEDDGNDLPPAA